MKLLIIIITTPCIFTICFIGQTSADVLHVPSDDYPTISDALADSFGGDQIIVAPGEYDEMITISWYIELIGAGTDKTTIRTIKISSSGAPPTVKGFTIDGQEKVPYGIDCESEATISDIAITNIKDTGINCRDKSPTISNVTITNAGGYGIYCRGGSPNISNVTITNTGKYGIYCESNSPNINTVTITNTGGGIYCRGSSPNISNVTITNVEGDGIQRAYGGSPIITNTIIKYSKGSGIAAHDSNYEGILKVRKCIITQNGKDGVYGASADLGTEEDPGGNEIFRNRAYNARGKFSAIGNWWGSDPPDEKLFRGGVVYKPWLTEPPISSFPTIEEVTPNFGSMEGGTFITITGSRFAAGAIVTVGSKSATEVSVDSETQITAITPAGTVGPADVTVTNPDGKSASKEAGFVYVAEGSGIYQINLTLTAGVNSFSLPLRPEEPITASKLAEDLKSTIVIRVQNGQFDAYVHDGKIGTDFPIEVGKGYIVNLLENRTYSLKGRPWGTEVPAAPTTPTTNTWAFVIAGRIDGPVPVGGYLCVTNRRTGESLVVPIPSVERAGSLLEKNELAGSLRSKLLSERTCSTGEFTAAFVDMSRRPVVAIGDEIIIQLIGMGGV
ncbi:MAG: right-handed parallel beta-helix repeat-containing protein, partial [Candidatus Poribacteria bacterium]